MLCSRRLPQSPLPTCGIRRDARKALHFFGFAIVAGTLLATGAQADEATFFGFSFESTLNEFKAEASISPLEKTAFRNAYRYHRQPAAKIPGLKNISYETNLYFVDDGRLGRVVINIKDAGGGLDLRGFAAPSIFHAIRRQIDRKYALTGQRLGSFLDKYMQCGAKCEARDAFGTNYDDLAIEMCSRNNLDNVFLYTALDGLLKDGATSEDVVNLFSFCEKQKSYIKYTSDQLDIQIHYEPNRPGSAMISLVGCTKMPHASGCEQVEKDLRKKKEKPF
ncbi:hypothetical protein [Xanthobacter pseudotagetidis]|uniref:hypothetical protein n=1 Tax=Xanthobacter pseudotagetidis TaxID=3119911 RepID=UPI00372C845A